MPARLSQSGCGLLRVCLWLAGTENLFKGWLIRQVEQHAWRSVTHWHAAASCFRPLICTARRRSVRRTLSRPGTKWEWPKLRLQSSLAVNLKRQIPAALSFFCCRLRTVWIAETLPARLRSSFHWLASILSELPARGINLFRKYIHCWDKPCWMAIGEIWHNANFRKNLLRIPTLLLRNWG